MVEKTRLNRSLFTPKPITLEIDNIRELSEIFLMILQIFAKDIL